MKFLLIVCFICACSGSVIQSKSIAEPIRIDGNQSDWGGRLVYVKNHHYF